MTLCVFLIKFYWNTVMLIHLCAVAAFHAIIAEVHSCEGDLVDHKAEDLLQRQRLKASVPRCSVFFIGIFTQALTEKPAGSWSKSVVPKLTYTFESSLKRQTTGCVSPLGTENQFFCPRFGDL